MFTIDLDTRRAALEDLPDATDARQAQGRAKARRAQGAA